MNLSEVILTGFIMNIEERDAPRQRSSLPGEKLNSFSGFGKLSWNSGNAGANQMGCHTGEGLEAINLQRGRFG